MNIFLWIVSFSINAIHPFMSHTYFSLPTIYFTFFFVHLPLNPSLLHLIRIITLLFCLVLSLFHLLAYIIILLYLLPIVYYAYCLPYILLYAHIPFHVSNINIKSINHIIPHLPKLSVIASICVY